MLFGGLKVSLGKSMGKWDIRLMVGFKLVNEQAFGTIDTWRRLRHANIVGVREAFTTKAFNDNCKPSSRIGLEWRCLSGSACGGV